MTSRLSKVRFGTEIFHKKFSVSTRFRKILQLKAELAEYRFPYFPFVIQLILQFLITKSHRKIEILKRNLSRKISNKERAKTQRTKARK